MRSFLSLDNIKNNECKKAPILFNQLLIASARLSKKSTHKLFKQTWISVNALGRIRRLIESSIKNFCSTQASHT